MLSEMFWLFDVDAPTAKRWSSDAWCRTKAERWQLVDPLTKAFDFVWACWQSEQNIFPSRYRSHLNWPSQPCWKERTTTFVLSDVDSFLSCGWDEGEDGFFEDENPNFSRPAMFLAVPRVTRQFCTSPLKSAQTTKTSREPFPAMRYATFANTFRDSPRPDQSIDAY